MAPLVLNPHGPRGAGAAPGKPHQVLVLLVGRLRPPPTQMSERELRALGFHRFDCHMQKELVWRLRSPRLGPYPTWHHEAWYHPETCMRRLVPQPLPWARCTRSGGSHLSDPLRLTGPSDDPPTRLAWC